MADYYATFSKILFDNLTPAEIQWLERAIPLAERYAEKHGLALPETIEIQRDALWIYDEGWCSTFAPMD